MSDDAQPQRRSWRDLNAGATPETADAPGASFDHSRSPYLPPTAEAAAAGDASQAPYPWHGEQPHDVASAAYGGQGVGVDPAGAADAGAWVPAGQLRGEDAQELSSSSRVWWRNPWVIAGAAVAIVAAGVVTVVLVNGDKPEGNVAAPTDSATPSHPATASPPASATPMTLLDDGIAEDEYPPAAQSLGDGYPEALVMEDWVWDKVTTGWVLVSYAPNPWSEVPQTKTGIYLASPEGRLFLLGDLPAEGGSYRAVSWIEPDHRARLQGMGAEGNQGSILLNLDSMTSEQMSFTVGAGKSVAENAVVADAANNELWVVWDEFYVASKLVRWSPGEGWSDAGLGSDVSLGAAYPSRDHSAVAFEYAPVEWSTVAGPYAGHLGRPNLVVIDVATGELTRLTPTYPGGDIGCTLLGLTVQRDPVLECTTFTGDSSYTSGYFTVSRDGALVSADANLLDPSIASWTNPDWTSAELGLRMEFLSDRGSVVRLESTADGSAILEAGQQLPYGGLMSPRLTTLGGELVLVSGSNGCAVVTPGGESVMLLATADANVYIACVPFE